MSDHYSLFGLSTIKQIRHGFAEEAYEVPERLPAVQETSRKGIDYHQSTLSTA